MSIDIGLMGQKFGVHQLRLVVYPIICIYLQGFIHSFQVVSRISEPSTVPGSIFVGGLFA